MQRRRIRKMVVLASLGVWTVSPVSGQTEPASPTSKREGEVRFTVQVDSDARRVVCALFEREGWLKQPIATAGGALRKGAAECVFTRVPEGTLAISAFADENDNGDLDTNWLGIPKEPWCASRNARKTLGPPAFDDASFSVTSGVTRLACNAH